MRDHDLLLLIKKDVVAIAEAHDENMLVLARHIRRAKRVAYFTAAVVLADLLHRVFA